MEYHTASVCVPPSYIKRIHDTYGEKINICTVVGFPLGYSTTKAKVAETVQAIEDGASEVDMVINIADVKNGDFEKVTEEIRSLKQAAGDKILKVIIEACYLTEKEKNKKFFVYEKSNFILSDELYEELNNSEYMKDVKERIKYRLISYFSRKYMEDKCQ